MWRSVLAVLLLPSMLRAQQRTLTQQETPPPVSTFQPSYQSFTQRETIRRGTSEKAAVSFMLGNDSFVSLVSPRNRGTNVIPLKLEFDNSEGIDVSDFAFPPDTKPHIAPQSENIRLIWPNVTIQFKVKASTQAPLGDRILKGKLKYQLVDIHGPLPALETEVNLPLTGVEHNALAINSPLYKQTFGHDNQMPPVWMWFSLPILIPLILVMVVVCGIRGEDCSC